MYINSLSIFVYRLIEWLTRPPMAVQNRQARQQARMLAALHISLLSALFVAAPIWIAFTPPFTVVRHISLGLLLAFLLTYSLSRSRHYLFGAAGLALIIFALVGSILLTAPGSIPERMLALKFLVVGVMISSLFLSPKVTVFVMGVSAGIIGLFFFIPEAPFAVTYSYLVFFLLVSALGTVGGVLRRIYREQLIASEERYRGAVTAMLDAFYLLESVRDADGEITDFRIVEVNETAVQQVSLPRTTLLGGLICELFPINRTGDFFDRYKRVVETGEPLDEEFHIPQAHAAPRWYHHQVVKVGDGVAIVTRDITEQKQSVNELIASEIRYRSLFEQSNDAVFILDLHGNHIQVNQRAAEMLGYQPDEIVGLSYRDLIVGEQQHESDSVWQRLLDGEAVRPYERTFRHQDGRLIATEINVEIIRNDKGAPLHMQSIVRDITERKQMQRRELKLALEQERVRLLQQFIESASHEFRTPLAIINTSTYLINHLSDPEKRQVKVAVIDAQVERIAKLVDILLLMTGLESGAPPIREAVDMETLLETVCKKMVAQYGERPTLRCDKPMNLPSLSGNVEELMVALTQILDNAYRFTPADGVITVATGAVDRHIWLTIQDTGPGIGVDDLPYIFETFWRKDKARTGPGFGLGLPIAQKIAQRHGGGIEVASAVGEGTLFKLVLPIESSEET